MSDEEMRRTMEFIVEQQAQFTVDIQQLKEVQAQAAERMDRLERAITNIYQDSSAKFNALIDAQMRMDAAMTRDRQESRAKFDALVDAQMRTDATVNKLVQAQVEAHARLVEAQEHTEQKLNALIEIVMERRNGQSQS